ncbi:oxidoreductase [Geodermatophilus sp. DF01-2]|uniref:dihydrolipoyl dehydrogenase family protein n=1 Tax=Geodermatophilus sp. DF01-2 TaxID=2559610 RepID=UPI001073078F|nr:FAD-dependent oxidoreductase [Geodermatophilus sp. DF01_2]TFV63531.1 oxidoreductase [Geodermatophilus sp. DF01_2]
MRSRGDDVVDLLVIGGGTAGMVGARTAAGLGARVLLVERDRTGGDCLWTGCVPSKALLAAADAAASARAAGRFGVDVGGITIDFGRVRKHLQAAIETIRPVDSVEALQAAGVAVEVADAVLTGSDSATVGGRTVRFRHALLATGAAPVLPPIDGLADADPLTSETVWDDLTELPARLAVLGGGPIGCELGQAFARLGSAVTVVDAADRLLPGETEEASGLVTAALRRDGVTVRTGAGVTAVRDGALQLADGAAVPFDRLLVAVGRRARTERLGCAAAGVEVADDGTVVVDGGLRTTNPRIWAAGDLTGHPQFTHTAGVHGSLAAGNALLGLRRTVDPVVPRVTYTSPEVASVGVPPGQGHSVRRVGHGHVDRAVAEGVTEGSTTLVLDRRRRIVGAAVVGPRAGEVLGELTLAVRKRMTTTDVAGTTHAYPTYSSAAWDAAVDDVRSRLAGPVVRRVLRAVVRLRAQRSAR